ncbi:hypothetical protein IX57_05240 [Paracoccus sanguinis]|nr:hypothetical protein IX57_05240 [Paracoccus sanguinis]
MRAGSAGRLVPCGFGAAHRLDQRPDRRRVGGIRSGAIRSAPSGPATGRIALHEAWSASTPAAISAGAFPALTPPPAMIATRPRAASTNARSPAVPSAAVAAWPAVMIRATPSATQSSSAARRSGVTSKARWIVTAIPPAAAIRGPSAARSSRPSASVTPSATPQSPACRAARMSSRITASSAAS